MWMILTSEYSIDINISQVMIDPLNGCIFDYLLNINFSD